MARARNIKPSFFKNDELAEIDPLGRLLFIGLWSLCDFKGDMEWREKRVKAELLPYDNCDVLKLAINLDQSGFIRYYSVQGKMYLNIPNFIKHQNPHVNERKKGSDIPEYSNESRQAVELKGLVINRDLSGLVPEYSESDRADSCSLKPDSPILIPDVKDLVANAPVDSWMCEFETFWMIYDKKEGRHKCELKFKKLTKADKDSLFTLLPAYIQSTPDKQYRKNPLTWLNGKHWNDEITTPVNQSPESMNTDTDWAKGILS